MVAYLDDGATNQVFEVDVTQNRVIATLKVGRVPGILALTPDGTELWVTDYYATNAWVIEVATGKVARSIPIGSQSYGIAFASQ